MDDVTSPSAPRAKRQKIDKQGRFAALERLRNLKGSKHKYEVSEMDNVYEEVDEREYTKKVLERQDDDWIVDDDGSGYVEDGRDIFDDDLDDDSIMAAAHRNKKDGGSGKRGRSGGKGSSMNGSTVGGKSSIRNMLMSMPSKKKKEAPIKLEEDAILGDIMEELNNENSSPSVILPSPRLNLGSSKKAVQQPHSLSADASVRNYIHSLSNAVTPTRNKSNSKLLTPRNITKAEPENICVPKSEPVTPMQEVDSDPEPTITEVPSPPKKEPVLSQTIEDFDSNDGFFDMTSVNEVEVKREQPVVEKKDDSKEKSELSIPSNQKSVSNGVPAPPKKTLEQHIPATWESIQRAGVPNDAAVKEVTVDPTQLPLTTTESGDKVLRFYWLDAHEEVFRQPGTVFMFGKVWIDSANSHVSTCVVVRNIQRRIYILPREKRYSMETKSFLDEEVTMMDVYKEFSEKIASKYKIQQFKSRKVEKNYAFNIPGVPFTSEYLEVLYPANQAVLPSDLQGETFSHVFGTNTSSLEQLLLDRKIKGPCWLDVKSPEPASNPISWCKLEASAIKPENVNVCSLVPAPPPPPLVVLTVNMRTVLSSTSQQNEIVMIACLVHSAFHIDKPAPDPPFQQHFCAFTRPSDMSWPYDWMQTSSRYKATKLDKMDTERALLGFFLAKLYKLDPDIIVGHDLYGYGLELLLHRMGINKIPQWSKLGRLRRANMNISKGKSSQLERNAMSGRLVCDVKISAKELIRSRSYDLGTLCQTVLRIKDDDRIDLTFDEVKQLYGASETLLKLISCTMQDASYVLRLMYELNVMPLALQITNIAGNVMSRTLLGGRSERNEFLLLHAFTEKNFIVPDKQYGKKPSAQTEDIDADEEAETSSKARGGKRKPAYIGGLVLEPRKGFYDKLILLMDFNSLYPSIIQEYNICFTTVNLNLVSASSDGEEPLVDLPKSGLELGILPTEIRKLVESRREVKKLMKVSDISADLKMQYNIRQMALKLTANSMYGCLGFSFSRFYAKPLAALVTSKGREILMNTKDLVEKMNYQVVYGDTDSIMINTNCLDYENVFKIGQKIKTEVNKLYKQVELDIDGVFKYMLLLKKKKYAAVTISRLPNGELVTSQELKGLDIVRRDWSQLSAEAGKFVLKQILSDQDPDDRILNIHDHLEKLRTDLEEGKVPLPLLTITKQLTKNPEEYPDSKALPHVQVALRINSQGGRRLKHGDTVAYVICEDGSSLPPLQRAYHVDELKNNESLKIDVKYYLSQQIHPVVSRLCDPIEGTDAGRIAECLGLDPTKYNLAKKNNETEESRAGEKLILSDEERFKDCDRFRFLCMNDSCKAEIVMDGPMRKNADDSICFALEKCTNGQCNVAPVKYLASIQNCLVLTMRKFIQRYYQDWLICEDPACYNRVRRLPLDFKGQFPHCDLCKSALMYKEYNDSELYTQLSFFQHIFDLPKHEKSRPAQEVENAYMKLREQVERQLRHSAYNVMDLGHLFQRLFTADPSEFKSIEIKQEPN